MRAETTDCRRGLGDRALGEPSWGAGRLWARARVGEYARAARRTGEPRDMQVPPKGDAEQ